MHRHPGAPWLQVHRLLAGLGHGAGPGTQQVPAARRPAHAAGLQAGTDTVTHPISTQASLGTEYCSSPAGLAAPALDSSFDAARAQLRAKGPHLTDLQTALHRSEQQVASPCPLSPSRPQFGQQRWAGGGSRDGWEGDGRGDGTAARNGAALHGALAALGVALDGDSTGEGAEPLPWQLMHEGRRC
jgi:hypothetical protein